MSSEISLVMMVKNEAHNLPRFLESVKDVWDELLVVDTGSTDQTPILFERAGARVIHSPWQNSFSFHRNEGLKEAKKEWILILDPDEEIDRLSKPYVRRAVKEAGDTYHGVWFTIRSFTSMGNYAQATSIRLFRNGRGVHYTNRLHNQVQIEGPFLASPIVIWHYGYAMPADQMISKYKERIKMLYEDLKEHPTDATLWHHAAVTHRAAREMQEAIFASDRAAELALSPGSGWVIEKFSWTRFIGALCTFFMGRVDEAISRCYQGLRECPTNMDFHYLLCKIAHDRNDLSKVIEHGSEYLRLREHFVVIARGVDSHFDTMNLELHIHSMVQDALMRTGGFNGLLMGIANGIGQDEINSKGNAGEVIATQTH